MDMIPDPVLSSIIEQAKQKNKTLCSPGKFHDRIKRKGGNRMELRNEKIIYGQRIQHIHLPMPSPLKAPGLILCYLCMEQAEDAFLHLKMEYESRLSSKEPFDYDYATEDFQKIFPILDAFMALFDREDFEYWELTFQYQKLPCRITGRKCKPIISFASPAGKPSPSLPFLAPVEETFKTYQEPDPKLIQLVMEQYSINRTVAEERIEKLRSRRDLFWEFACKCKEIIPESPVMAKGYTAEELHRNYPLSWLGAYLYMVDLRERPKWALEQLKTGLKRK